MLAKVNSFALSGLEGYSVDIEVDINAGLPKVELIGLPDAAVKEAAERVSSAIKNSGYHFPVKKLVINLAPADTRKEGSVFDLPIAIGVLAASEQLHTKAYKDYVIFGELSLDGNVRGVNGVIAAIISAMQQGYTKFIIPSQNKEEASYISGVEVYCVSDLKEACAFLEGTTALQPIANKSFVCDAPQNAFGNDFCDIKGQAAAKRALEIAVAGGHNVLMIGPPGAGKTMLAKCLVTIMPDLTLDEALEITKIHSVAGVLDAAKGIVSTRPFRTPHHTATVPALVGGGSKSTPGEVSLAHYGVLFLDEVPEYARHTLETLRQPLEDGVITVARAQQTVTYPARFMLVGSMNPCPCGNFGSKTRVCTCTPQAIRNYVNKLSGPLLDRIDIQIEVDALEFAELRSTDNSAAETSATVRARVAKAREVQNRRYQGCGIVTNAEMNNRHIKQFCAISPEAEALLENAYTKLHLSARANYRILRVARTIADIEGAENISTAHIAEAIQYRSLDRKYWN